MKKIEFNVTSQENLVNDIIDQLVEELHENNFKLVAYINSSDFENAAIIRDHISKVIYNTNLTLFGLTGLDLQKQMEIESDYVREQISENWSKIIEALDGNDDLHGR